MYTHVDAARKKNINSIFVERVYASLFIAGRIACFGVCYRNRD